MGDLDDVKGSTEDQEMQRMAVEEQQELQQQVCLAAHASPYKHKLFCSYKALEAIKSVVLAPFPCQKTGVWQNLGPFHPNMLNAAAYMADHAHGSEL